MTRNRLLASSIVLTFVSYAMVPQARAIDREVPGTYGTVDLAIAAAVVANGDKVVISQNINDSFTLNKAIEVTLKAGVSSATITGTGTY